MLKKICILISLTILLANFSFSEKIKFWLRFPTYSRPTMDFIDNLKLDYPNLADDHIQKFVWVNQPFHASSYKPNDLVDLQWLSHISAQKYHKLRKEAAENLENLANDFHSHFWKNIVVISAYRSYSYQKNSISENCKQTWYCAKEWESEHQLWLAIDLREATNEKKFLSKYKEYYDRLKDNAHLYWFHQSYQNWKEIDGYYIEPWHWRYLWKNLATKLYENSITFTQYIKTIN